MHATGAIGIDAGTMLLADGNGTQITAVGSEAGIICEGMPYYFRSLIQGNNITEDGKYGILIREAGNAMSIRAVF